MGEVLTDAAPLAEYFIERSGDGGKVWVVFEFPVNSLIQIRHGFQQGPPRRETGFGIFPEFGLDRYKG